MSVELNLLVFPVNIIADFIGIQLAFEYGVILSMSDWYVLLFIFVLNNVLSLILLVEVLSVEYWVVINNKIIKGIYSALV